MLTHCRCKVQAPRWLSRVIEIVAAGKIIDCELGLKTFKPSQCSGSRCDFLPCELSRALQIWADPDTEAQPIMIVTADKGLNATRSFNIS